MVSLSHELEIASRHKSRPLIPSPYAHGDWIGWLASFASFTMLVLVSWAGSLGQMPWIITLTNVLILAPWGYIVLRQVGTSLRAIMVSYGLLILPLLALSSVIWSDVPAASLKAGVEYALTTLIGILAGHCIAPRILISAILSALLLVTVASLLYGAGEGASFVDLFGSKNYFALYMSFLLLTGITIALDKLQPAIFRLLGLVAIIMAAPLLVYANSTGALIVSIVTLTVTLMLRFVVKLSPKPRLGLLAFILAFMLLAVTVATVSVDYADVLEYLGKDVTLTGRTLLWRYADASIADHLVLGVGYEAFWQPTNSAAVQLWFYSYVPNQRGYHFHNTFLQIAVDLGLVGLAIFVSMISIILIRLFARMTSNSPTSEQMFAIAIFIFLLLRMPVEVDLFFPFQLASILLCLVWIYLQPAAPNRISTSDVPRGGEAG